MRNSDASILVLHLFPAFNHPNNQLPYFYSYLPPLDSVAKKQLFLGRKNIGGAFSTPLHPPSHAYAQ
jgi:hypothetical protein